jgi:AcrR family transcriptional regulator
MPGATLRPGPRGAEADTRASILREARRAFGELGYSATTLRSVAAAAGVDVALIPYYFGSKQELFTTAMDVPVRPREVIADAFALGPDQAGARLVDRFLGLWEDPVTGPAMLAMFRSAAGHEESRRALSEFASAEILRAYAAHLTGADAALRASLAASQLVGVVMLRFVLRVEPVADLPREVLVASLGPTVQRYLTGPLG